MKILIIDDSLMDRKLLASLLKRSGVSQEILQSVDGEEGIRTLSGNYQDICLILLDWQMPKIDGIEFMKRVIQIPEAARIPIIMITASSSDADKTTARSVNPNLAGYIVKPYNADVLMQAIRPYLK